MLTFFEDRPVRYEITYYERGLGIRIRKAVWASLVCHLSPTAPLVVGLTEEFGLPDFIEPAYAGWGFGPVLKIKAESADWLEWICPLPNMNSAGDNRWNLARAVVNTLTVIFTALSLDSQPMEAAARMQLMTVDVYCMKRPTGGYPLCGQLSPKIVVLMEAMLKDCPKNHQIGLEEVELAMRVSWEKVFGSCQDDKRFIAFLATPCRLVLQCPGDACELYSPPNDYEPGYGLEIECHNVDSPVQQLSLLMGLAKFHDLLREVE